MRKISRNIFLVFFITLLGATLAWAQQSPANLLQKADSLYGKGRYTEAGLIYRQVLDVHQSYSPQMLAKSAFIAEGSENYDEALYYLMLLYSKQQSEALYNKITDLAARYELSDYTVSDVQYMTYTLQRYLPYWGSLLVGLALLWVIYLSRKRQRKQVSSVVAGLGILLLAIFIYLIQTFLSYPKAIIRSEKAFNKNDPSARF